MELTTPVKTVASHKQWGRDAKFASIGSCFSEHMAARLARYRCDVLSNPHGIVFHPDPMGRSLLDMVNGDQPIANNIIETQQGFVSLDHHGAFRFADISNLLQNIQDKQRSFRHQLEQADVLIVTLGTAWGHFHVSSNRIVANCHKLPSNQFVKMLSDGPTMLEQWKMLLTLWMEVNPKLNVIFTVSPVRHTKEGLVENQRSKSRLIELAHALADGWSNTYYFPSYEIMMDELRDYRFYERDMIHPNSVAVDIIWNRWMETFLDEKSRAIIQRMEPFLRRIEHKGLHETAEESMQRKAEAEEAIRQLINP